MTQPLIALLTDFGTSDAYVGIMKGVIIARCPEVRFIDISHAIAPQNIRQAAYLLQSAYRYFPTHTVFLVVVDPGVGTRRNAIAVKTDHGTYIGPDNDVFSAVLDQVEAWQAISLTIPDQMCGTFHGRDIFAPAVAQIANGELLNQIGSPITDLVRIPVFPMEQPTTNTLIGEVIHIDHFGNLITSIGPFDWHNNRLSLEHNIDLIFDAVLAEIKINSHMINGIQHTYGEWRNSNQ
jgi:S-adenosylmethionine hydrolase